MNELKFCPYGQAIKGETEALVGLEQMLQIPSFQWKVDAYELCKREEVSLSLFY